MTYAEFVSAKPGVRIKFVSPFSCARGAAGVSIFDIPSNTTATLVFNELNEPQQVIKIKCDDAILNDQLHAAGMLRPDGTVAVGPDSDATEIVPFEQI